jgi:hypothetical protein
MATVTCPVCGTENPDDKTYCRHCRNNFRALLEHPEKVGYFKAGYEAERHMSDRGRSITKFLHCVVGFCVGGLLGAWIAINIAFTFFGARGFGEDTISWVAAIIGVIVGAILGACLVPKLVLLRAQS